MKRTIQLTAIGSESFPVCYAQQETSEKATDRIAMRMIARRWCAGMPYDRLKLVRFVLVQWFTSMGKLHQMAFSAYDLDVTDGDVVRFALESAACD